MSFLRLVSKEKDDYYKWNNSITILKKEDINYVVLEGNMENGPAEVIVKGDKIRWERKMDAIHFQDLLQQLSLDADFCVFTNGAVRVSKVMFVTYYDYFYLNSSDPKRQAEFVTRVTSGEDLYFSYYSEQSEIPNEFKKICDTLSYGIVDEELNTMLLEAEVA